VAAWQAQAASSAEVRRIMRRIARDEADHAALAFAVAAWTEPLLTREERERVARARDRALRSLARELRREPPAEACAHAGVPTASVGAALVRALPRLQA
jgi:hypothetical protein